MATTEYIQNVANDLQRQINNNKQKNKKQYKLLVKVNKRITRHAQRQENQNMAFQTDITMINKTLNEHQIRLDLTAYKRAAANCTETERWFRNNCHKYGVTFQHITDEKFYGKIMFILTLFHQRHGGKLRMKCDHLLNNFIAGVRNTGLITDVEYKTAQQLGINDETGEYLYVEFKLNKSLLSITYKNTTKRILREIFITKNLRNWKYGINIVELMRKYGSVMVKPNNLGSFNDVTDTGLFMYAFDIDRITKKLGDVEILNFKIDEIEQLDSGIPRLKFRSMVIMTDVNLVNHRITDANKQFSQVLKPLLHGHPLRPHWWYSNEMRQKHVQEYGNNYELRLPIAPYQPPEPEEKAAEEQPQPAEPIFIAESPSPAPTTDTAQRQILRPQPIPSVIPPIPLRPPVHSHSHSHSHRRAPPPAPLVLHPPLHSSRHNPLGHSHVAPSLLSGSNISGHGPYGRHHRDQSIDVPDHHSMILPPDPRMLRIPARPIEQNQDIALHRAATTFGTRAHSRHTNLFLGVDGRRKDPSRIGVPLSYFNPVLR